VKPIVQQLTAKLEIQKVELTYTLLLLNLLTLSEQLNKLLQDFKSDLS